MIGLDCNILVQLAFGDYAANAQTILAVHAEIQKGEKLVFPSLLVAAFLHVTTAARRFAPPLTMAEALDWIEEFLQNPAVSLLEPSRASIDQSLRWMRQFNLGRKRIPDTQLAAVLNTNGVRRLLTSNPADFAVFSILEIVIP
jgi:predicted nucleic acid-binding protein